MVAFLHIFIKEIHLKRTFKRSTIQFFSESRFQMNLWNILWKELKRIERHCTVGWMEEFEYLKDSISLSTLSICEFVWKLSDLVYSDLKLVNFVWPSFVVLSLHRGWYYYMKGYKSGLKPLQVILKQYFWNVDSR